MAASRLCSIPNCGKLARTRGWCVLHYKRAVRHGNPLKGRTPKGEPERFFHEVVLTYEGEDCLIWPYSRNRGGYGRLLYKGKLRNVSHLVCREQNGPPPTIKHDAAHSCGRGHLGCVTNRHLSWKTRAENAADRLIHGTDARGEKSPTAKLTNDEARQILALRGIMFQREIAAHFGVSRSLVWCIHHGRRWAWLN